MRRAAAGLLVAAVMAAGTVSPARAEGPEITAFNPADCEAIKPAADNEVPQAWHLDRLQMDEVWKIATGKGIRVAIVDTGVATLGTPFVKPERITTYDALGGMSQVDSANYGVACRHGTQVMGLLGAGQAAGQPVDVRTNFSGIAPDVEMIAYRALPASGPYLPDEPTEGDAEPKEDARNDDRDSVGATIASIRHAISQDVDIINLSMVVLSTDPQLGELQAAVQEALDAGIVVVAAAGNVVDGMHGAVYPASFEGVISVGMTNPTDAPSNSSWPAPPGAPPVAIGAPGDGVMSIAPSAAHAEATYVNQAYDSPLQGTSYAAPIVSGVVALMLETNPGLTPAEVEQRLINTADPSSAAAPASRLGFGIVNPMRAIAGVAMNPGDQPSDDVTASAEPLPEPFKLNPAILWGGIGIGVGATVLALGALVASIVLPAARRRNAQSSSSKVDG